LWTLAFLGRRRRVVDLNVRSWALRLLALVVGANRTREAVVARGLDLVVEIVKLENSLVPVLGRPLGRCWCGGGVLLVFVIVF
jgi:hypothetical protein